MMDGKFKMTEVGLVPEDWEVRRLGDLFDFKNGLNKGKEFFGYGTPIVNFTDVFNNPKMYKDSIKGLVSVNNNDIKSCNVHKGDVFFTRTSETPEEVGMSSVLLDEIDSAVFSGFVLRARPKTKLLDSEYSGTALRSKCIRNQIIKSASYTTRALTSGAKLSSVLIPLPPLPEQQKISKALSDVDGLISSLDALIAKKRDIKKGAMQQLLTGKKRLPGFEEAWVEKRLGEIGKTFGGLTGKTKADFEDGTSRYITFLNVLNNPILKPELFEMVDVKQGERQNKCLKGDLFFNTSSETPEEVGICAMLNHSIDSLYLNSFCFGFRLNDETVNSTYLAYFFRSREGRMLMTTLAQGVTRYNLSKSSFVNAMVLLPPTLPEQSAIAAILTSMDDEIATLEAKRDKYISIKQGMMQELLTGKTRLI